MLAIRLYEWYYDYSNVVTQAERDIQPGVMQVCTNMCVLRGGGGH